MLIGDKVSDIFAYLSSLFRWMVNHPFLSFLLIIGLALTAFFAIKGFGLYRKPERPLLDFLLDRYRLYDHINRAEGEGPATLIPRGGYIYRYHKYY